MQIVSWTYLILILIYIPCILYFHGVHTSDEHFPKEVDFSSNSTKPIDSTLHKSTCRKKCHLISPQKSRRVYRCYCLSDLDLCSVDINCCEKFPTDCPSSHKKSLKGFERLLGLQGDCLKLVNSLSTFGCPHKSNWLKEAEREVTTSWYDDHLLYTRSCRNRCSRTEPEIFNYILCSCDVRCPVYRNCCEDFSTECPLVHKESLKKFGHMMDLQVDCLDVANTFAIVGCPHQTNYTRKLINQDSFPDILDNTPVTDVTTGLVFINMDIYNCNMPGRSNLTLKWNIFAELEDNNQHRPILEFKKPLKLFKPCYRAPTLYADKMSKCNPNSISLCNNSILLQRQCQSFLPFSLLKNMIKNYNLCRACSVSARLSFYNLKFFFRANVSIFTDTLLYHGLSLYWVEAKCDMSPNATLSRAQCYIVRCSHQEGYYLHNGTCRTFYLLSIAFQLELMQLNDNQKENIFNFIKYHLYRVLNVGILGTVTPLMSLYNGETQQNMTVATFMFDFNSSALADFFYYTYRDGLSALAAQLRTYVVSLRETLLSRTRPSPTSLYGLIIQAPLMSHFIASYTRAGVFCYLKAVLSSSPHIPVEGESLITLDLN
nr:hypothetical protein BgiMline_006847 [Biomphalaria glabrata]